jgi:hypothetical protein
MCQLSGKKKKERKKKENVNILKELYINIPEVFISQSCTK